MVKSSLGEKWTETKDHGITKSLESRVAAGRERAKRTATRLPMLFSAHAFDHVAERLPLTLDAIKNIHGTLQERCPGAVFLAIITDHVAIRGDVPGALILDDPSFDSDSITQFVLDLFTSQGQCIACP